MLSIHNSDPILGVRKIHQILLSKNLKLSLNTAFKLAKECNIKAKIKVKYKPLTTKADPAAKAFPNLINQKFNVSEPNTVWVSDITYIRVANKWNYLAVVIDLYDRFPVGWAFGHSPDAELVCSALKRAIKSRNYDKTQLLIHHSDQGSQYTSMAFKKLLTNYHILGSVSKRGSPYDNSVAENFFQKLKVEHVNDFKYSTFEAAWKSLYYYIEVYYLYFRPHASLGYMTPYKFSKAI